MSIYDQYVTRLARLFGITAGTERPVRMPDRFFAGAIGVVVLVEIGLIANLLTGVIP